MEKLLLKTFLSLMIIVAVLSCEEDEGPSLPEAGTISGGPFSFVVDGQPDMVSGISTDGTSRGTNAGWIITDAENNILGLPPDIAALEGVDFDGAGTGVCLIWYIRYEDDLVGLEAGRNVSGLDGTYDLSNSITVDRNAIAGGSISGGPFTFVVDGAADNVSGITLDASNINGSNTSWLITDASNNILGLPPTLEAVEGVNFDGAGPGVCFIWHITYSGTFSGLEAGSNINQFSGTYALSNSISVTRASAGELMGGPFTFMVDGTPDFATGISVANNEDLSNTGYVITDDQNNILGLPPTLDALSGVNFDGAGQGVCLIWRITYEDGLTGLEAGQNVSGLSGALYSLSNSITVTRN